MKRILILLYLIFIYTGCNDNSSNDNLNTNSRMEPIIINSVTNDTLFTNSIFLIYGDFKTLTKRNLKFDVYIGDIKIKVIKYDSSIITTQLPDSINEGYLKIYYSNQIDTFKHKLIMPNIFLNKHIKVTILGSDYDYKNISAHDILNPDKTKSFVVDTLIQSNSINGTYTDVLRTENFIYDEKKNNLEVRIYPQMFGHQEIDIRFANNVFYFTDKFEQNPNINSTNINRYFYFSLTDANALLFKMDKFKFQIYYSQIPFQISLTDNIWYTYNYNNQNFNVNERVLEFIKFKKNEFSITVEIID